MAKNLPESFTQFEVFCIDSEFSWFPNKFIDLKRVPNEEPSLRFSC